MSKNYVNLHVHSEYSVLDGFGKIKEYVNRAKELNMIGLGLTDHGTCAGLYELIKECKENDLIPVPGLEAYLAPINPDGAKCKNPVYYGKNGIKAPDHDVSGNGAYTHITLFAYNNIGLHNLFRLTSISYQSENFYQSPRIDINMLSEYSEGLIVATGCPGSEINKRFLLNQDNKAYEFANRLKDIFGKNLYVEIMNHGIDFEKKLIPKLIKLANDLDLKIIATNDTHYANQADAEPHERMLCIQSKSKMFEATHSEGGSRFSFENDQFYMKSYDEMLGLFPEEILEESLRNTEELTLKCKNISLDYDPNLTPIFPLPEGYTEVTYLKKLIKDGWNKKRANHSEEVKKESKKRIKEEFDFLHSNNFLSFFLVTEDAISYARKNNIGIGDGRGSVGGSEIAYVLDIHDTDPIRFDLMFERFLSPGRCSIYTVKYKDNTSEEILITEKHIRILLNNKKENVFTYELKENDKIIRNNKEKVIDSLYVSTPGSPPDIDTDFHTEGRDKVMQYCIEKFGREYVSNIVTFGVFKAKSSFKALCTIYNKPHSIANKISGMIPPPDDEGECTIEDILNPNSHRYDEGEDFRNATKEGEWKETLEMAIPLDRRINVTGVHPAGLIISRKPLSDTIPTWVRSKDGITVTQWTYPQCEDLGLMKMDFLGLNTINIIELTLNNIKTMGKEPPNMREIGDGPMNDPKTYELLQSGKTMGIFQLSGSGVRDLLRRMKPTKFMDIAALTALYRPGPMKMNSHNEYADRKNGLKTALPIHKEFVGTVVDDILKETYGTIVYQEQCMKIAQELCGFTSIEADELRQAIGKKKMALMMKIKPKFTGGCVKNGISEGAAQLLWETIEDFGKYAFNRAHSVSYAKNAYKTVYLKANYPAEFMAALIQLNSKNKDDVRIFLQEANSMGLKVGPVDINLSQVNVSAINNSKYDIVYGFSGVKQMNVEVSEIIVNERNKNGEYKSIQDFLKRISKHIKMGSQGLQNIALAGAFDSFGNSRKLIKEKASVLITSGTKEINQGLTLFGAVGSTQGSALETMKLSGDDYDYNEKIKLEADAIGMFISGHPIDNLGPIKKSFNAKTLSELRRQKNQGEQTIICTITEIDSGLNRSGRRSIKITLDDKTGTVTTFLSKQLVQSIEKGVELKRIEKEKTKTEEQGLTYTYEQGTSKRALMLYDILHNDDIISMDNLELYDVYKIKLKTRGEGIGMQIGVIDIEKINTMPDGSLPYEIIIKNKKQKEQVYDLVKKYHNEVGTYIKIFNKINEAETETVEIIDKPIKLSQEFIMKLEQIISPDNIITKGV